MDANQEQIELLVSLIGGPVGSLAYAVLHDNTTIKQKSADVFVGSAAALFLGPWIAASMSIQSLAGYRVVIFLSGLFGNVFIRTATTYAEKNAADLFVGFIKRIFGQIQQAANRKPQPQDDKNE